MGNKQYSPVLRDFERTKAMFEMTVKPGQAPLTFEDSLSVVSNYPYSAFGLLTAEGKHGGQKGIAFVVADNYLLTCASNCYSHLHGKQYTILTFAINSNRQAGIETHRISKIFVPEQYKQLPEKQRGRFNFALLYIAGEPNFKDKYGSLGLCFENAENEPLIYSEWLFQKQGETRMVVNHRMQDKALIQLSGVPLIHSINGYVHIAKGLAFQEGNNSEPSFLVFDGTTHHQLAQWAIVQNGCLDLSQITSEEILKDLSKSMSKKTQPIQKLVMPKAYLGSKCTQILESLPFATVSHLDLSCRLIQDNHLDVLKIDKFKNLLKLDLFQNNIGALGCKRIAEASLTNLRVLWICFNKIGDEGCEYLSKANWPFLRSIQLQECMIGNDGLHSLTRSNWKNLNGLFIKDININNQISKDIDFSSFPRLTKLFLTSTSINYIGLQFLKSPSWISLRHLNLSQTNLGTKGCKLIKESAIALSQLQLGKYQATCSIDDVGVKWLCKADLRNIHNLQLSYNKIGDKGCRYLSQTNLPQLNKIELEYMRFGKGGFKWLLSSDWREQAYIFLVLLEQCKMEQYIHQFRRNILQPQFIGRFGEKFLIA